MNTLRSTLRAVAATLLVVVASACRQDATAPALSPEQDGPMAAINLTTGWTTTGGNATVTPGTAANSVQLGYGGYPFTYGVWHNWSFQQVATETTVLPLAWSHTGLHSWFQAQAQMEVWAKDGLGNIATVVLVNSGTYDNFAFSGSHALAVTAGQPWGVNVRGYHYDSSQIVQGNVTLSLPAPVTGTVAGTVRDAVTNAGIAGATVTIGTYSAIANTSGQYQIVGVPAGSYTMGAMAVGYLPAAGVPETITAGNTTIHDFALSPPVGTISGVVTDAVTGQPIGGATVSTLLTSGPATATTSPTGAYSLPGIPLGNQTVTAGKATYSPETATVNVVAAGATQNFALQPIPHTLAVTVTNPNNTPATGIAVTATNVADGSIYEVVCTNTLGVASIQVPAGSYVVHARNLPICSQAQLQVWPYVSEAVVINTATTEGANRVGVVYQASTQASLTLNPANYKQQVQAPLALGQGGSSSIGLQFGQGATVQCALLDANGQPFTMQFTEHFYSVQPFGDETGLPPVPTGANPNGLPRGIATLLATLEAGTQSDDCSITGVAAGEYVLETNYVAQPGGGVVTYRESVTVTQQQASSGATVTVQGEPEPVRARTGYLLEKLGDASKQTDLGLVTYGWGVNNPGTPSASVSNTFHVAADFVGQGHYTVELTTSKGQTISATANCTAKECKLIPKQPKNLHDRVAISGTVVKEKGGATGGTVVWSFTLPELGAGDWIRFRIVAGEGQVSDLAPASGTVQAVKPSSPGDGNSWLIANI